ncbi:MAG: hypothetical protein LUD51_02980 [Clostridia bacterium]|nr:hypothetical protein [Clostridia bacterium]
MAKASKKAQKVWVLIFYIIILLGLLAGFLIPMNFEADDITGSMLLMQIPDALSKVLASCGIEWAALNGAGSALAISSPMSLIMGSTEITLDVNAWLTVIYALITFLSVICIIPAIAGCVTKKDKAIKKKEKEAKKAAKAAKKAAKKGEVIEEAAPEVTDPLYEELPEKKKVKETTFRTAFFIDVFAAIVLFIMNLMILVDMQFIGGDICLPIIVAFGVVVIVGAIQRMVASGGSGLVKFILFILSLVVIFVAFFDIRAIIPSLADSINGSVSNSTAINAGFFGGEGADGLEYLSNFVFYTEGSMSSLFPEYLSSAGWAFTIGAIILGIMVLVNCFLDLLGIYKKTNKFMLVFNQIRYIIEILALILCIIMVAADKDLNYGLMLIIASVLIVISYIINIIRIARYRKAREAELMEPDESEEFAYFAPARTEPAQTVYISSFSEPAFAAAYNNAIYDIPPVQTNRTFYPQLITVNPELKESPAAKASKPVPTQFGTPAQSATVPAAGNAAPLPETNYKVQTIYNGPMDRFISKLSNDEKVEFARVFLERAERPLSAIHEYVVGGDNSVFFSDVIMYYTSVRDIISDSLMTKLYDEEISRQQ